MTGGSSSSSGIGSSGGMVGSGRAAMRFFFCAPCTLVAAAAAAALAGDYGSLAVQACSSGRPLHCSDLLSGALAGAQGQQRNNAAGPRTCVYACAMAAMYNMRKPPGLVTRMLRWLQVQLRITSIPLLCCAAYFGHAHTIRYVSVSVHYGVDMFWMRL